MSIKWCTLFWPAWECLHVAWTSQQPEQHAVSWQGRRIHAAAASEPHERASLAGHCRTHAACHPSCWAPSVDHLSPNYIKPNYIHHTLDDHLSAMLDWKHSTRSTRHDKINSSRHSQPTGCTGHNNYRPQWVMATWWVPATGQVPDTTNTSQNKYWPKQVAVVLATTGTTYQLWQAGLMSSTNLLSAADSSIATTTNWSPQVRPDTLKISKEIFSTAKDGFFKVNFPINSVRLM